MRKRNILTWNGTNNQHFCLFSPKRCWCLCLLFNPFHFGYRLCVEKKWKLLRCVKRYVMIHHRKAWCFNMEVSLLFTDQLTNENFLIAWLFKRINSYREASNNLFTGFFLHFNQKALNIERISIWVVMPLFVKHRIEFLSIFFFFSLILSLIDLNGNLLSISRFEYP